MKEEDQENSFCLLMHLFHGFGYNSAYITSGKSLYQPCSDHFDLKDLPTDEDLKEFPLNCIIFALAGYL